MSRITITKVKCRHCGASFGLPDLPPEILSEVAALVRGGHLFGAAAHLYTSSWKRPATSIFTKIFHPLRITKSPLDSDDPITAIKHVTNPFGTCRICRHPITTLGQSECPNCHAVNLNW